MTHIQCHPYIVLLLMYCYCCFCLCIFLSMSCSLLPVVYRNSMGLASSRACQQLCTIYWTSTGSTSTTWSILPLWTSTHLPFSKDRTSSSHQHHQPQCSHPVRVSIALPITRLPYIQCDEYSCKVKHVMDSIASLIS